MGNITVTYEEIVTEVKLARSDGRITEKEYQKLIGAIIKGKFRNDQDPIIDKIFDEESNSPIEDTKEADHEEN